MLVGMAVGTTEGPSSSIWGLLRARRRFRRLFVAHAISRAGDAFNSVALVVLVFSLTGSGLGVAATVVFEVVPIVLFGPLAGLVADRFPRRRVMVGADLLRAGLAAALMVAHGSVALAFAVAFGLSVGSLLFGPASMSVVPETVEADELVTANSALWSVAVAVQILLAPVAGGLIAFFGVGIAFGVNALSFVASAALLWRLDAGRVPAASAARGWRAVRLGIDLVRADRLLRPLAVVQVLASLSVGATSGLLVVLAAEQFGVGPSGFGLLLAAIGIGAVTGPLVLRRWVRPGDRRWLFGPYALRGFVDLGLAATTSAAMGGVLLTAYGVGTSTGMVAYQSTLQTAVTDEARGRVFAVFDVAWNAARLISLGLGGVAADRFGIRAVYVAGGLLLLFAFVVGYTTRAEPEDATLAS